MNYYPFHIGDYASHTSHLDPMEDLAYRRLMDLYYLREGELPLGTQEIARLIRMRQNESEIEIVLGEFFERTETGWRHERCEAEIARSKEAQGAVNEKNENEKKRMQRYRERRAEMFEMLRIKGVIPEWDISMKDLQRLCDDNAKQPETHLQRERDVSGDSPATAISTNTNTNTKDTSSLRSDGACDEALAAKAMRAVGLQTANPSDPRLAKLLAEGVTIDELTYVAEEAVRLGKPFAYALAMAAGRREDAAKLQVGKPPGRRTPPPENFEAKDYGTGVMAV